ncbi:MAG: acyltransferase [Bacteroidetes bacterium 4572_77]|nr:MAG: acyltransferase [Bacteroidetes bacterium 4572_77]
MLNQDIYKDIRPYLPAEVPLAVARIMENPQFQLALDYLYSKEEHAAMIAATRSVKSGFEFQKVFMYPAIKKVLKLSSQGLALSGVDFLKNNGPSVLLSNHRDILLDSAILQTVLVDQDMETSEITFGSNLMINDFIIDFGKINRMYKVHREGAPRELLRHAQHLSAYINHTIKDKKVSSWIAQRKGRTKNGWDKTDTGVLKMLTVFDRKKPFQAYKAINILPVAISYEWEPCDLQKVRELYLSEKQTYVKKADEDFKAVINGIINPKGHIKMAFGKPLNQFLEENKSIVSLNNIHQEVARFIDEQVSQNYQLYPNNYAAYDMLFDSQEYSAYYKVSSKEELENKLQQLYQLVGEENAQLKQMFLKLYANPILQKKHFSFM